MTELKKCPFCGSSAAVLTRKKQRVYDRKGHPKLPKTAVYIGDRQRQRFRYDQTFANAVPYMHTEYIYEVAEITVCCSDTRCMAHKTEPRVHELEKAVERWNRRAGDVSL